VNKSLKAMKNILLSFVLISIGFALGKHYAGKTVQDTDTEKSSLVRVYYMHANFRCATCNRIQELTEKLLKDKYAKQMDSGKIDFVEVNFQKNEALAERFDIKSSCVVVAKIRAGKIAAHQTLNEVWTLYQKPAEFNAYISKAIQTYLEKDR
jgi:anaerobic ribonucleoside-triphosphate reductase